MLRASSQAARLEVASSEGAIGTSCQHCPAIRRLRDPIVARRAIAVTRQFWDRNSALYRRVLAFASEEEDNLPGSLTWL